MLSKANTDMVNLTSQNSTALSTPSFLFLLVVILKTAQCSSSVAFTTTTGHLASLMTTVGFTTLLQVALTFILIGFGAMTVSHANDSYFSG